MRVTRVCCDLCGKEISAPSQMGQMQTWVPSGFESRVKFTIAVDAVLFPDRGGVVLDICQPCVTNGLMQVHKMLTFDEKKTNIVDPPPKRKISLGQDK